MNWILKHLQLILFIGVAFWGLYLFYQNGVLSKKLDATKMQKIDVKKEGLERENRDLKVTIKLKEDTLKQFKNLAFQLDSIVKNGSKKDKNIIKKLDEKFTVIDGLDANGRDSIFTRKGFHPYAIKPRN